MANKILIKRSLNTANATSLANGELAYSSNGDVLFIGANGAVVPIGGKRVPGTLTANQSIVVNANGFIDVTKTNKLVLGADGTTANVTSIILDGTLASASNTDLASAWAVKSYIDTQAGSSTLGGLSDVTVTSPANNDILVYDAASGQWENHTVSGTANEITATYSGQNLTIGLPDDVTITANLSVSQSLTVTNSATFSNTVVVNGGLTANAGLTTNKITANGSVGTAGQFLRTGGAATNAYYSDITLGTDTTGDYVATITAGNGITGAGTGEGSAPTIAVNANNGLTANATGVFVNANSGLVSNSSGVFVNANNGITANADGVFVKAGTGITVDGTGVSIGQNVATTANVTFNDVTVSGNLFVNGTLTQIDTDNVTVEDSLMKLARNNTASDSLDIGFYGAYGATGTKYTGFFRDATDSTYKLFSGLESDPTTTVNLAGTGYSIATLQAYLTTGAFVANSSAVSITANSSVAVSITANSITLSTPLATTSGGTGFNTYTSGDLLVANTANALSKLSLGVDGLVLQSNGSALIYADLDGGTF
jgi:hypothetical protein